MKQLFTVPMIKKVDEIVDSNGCPPNGGGFISVMFSVEDTEAHTCTFAMFLIRLFGDRGFFNLPCLNNTISAVIN